MSNEVFQKVFDLIQPYLPDKWSKMVLYVAYTTGSYSMKFYSSDENNTFIDCFSMKTIDKAQLIKLFMSIDKALSSERKDLNDMDKWTVMTMTVRKSGEMKTEFDYSDISENAIAYEQSWKEKYLKK